MAPPHKTFLEELRECISLQEKANYKIAFSPSEAIKKLQEVIENPPELDDLGIGFFTGEKIVGAVNEDEVYIARYRSFFHQQRKYGYFRGNFIQENGNTFLKGSYDYFAKGLLG